MLWNDAGIWNEINVSTKMLLSMIFLLTFNKRERDCATNVQ